MTSAETRPSQTHQDPQRKAARQPDQLVVSLPYEHLVKSQLKAWGALPEMGKKDRDPRLGLALLGLDAAAAVEHLRKDEEYSGWPHEVAQAAENSGYPTSDLDITMRCLRRFFADKYGGWAPTFGKNREVTRVSGSYVIDITGGGRPQAIGPLYVIDITGGGSEPNHVSYPDGAKVVPVRPTSPGAGVRVGVVDTRLSQHPWLAGGYVASAGDLIQSEPPSDMPFTADHATFVTGLILRQAPGSVVELRSGLRDDASQDSWSVAQSIADLASNNNHVVNLSLGCLTEDDQAPMVLAAALAALSPETLVVAAAGNHGDNSSPQVPRPSWPAALDNVIAVGAVDADNKVANFSPHTAWVDAMAPGVEVVSTCDTVGDGSGLFASWSGTSFASAVVTGAIASRVKDGRTAREAWQAVSKESADRDPDGRPIVSLKRLKGWPRDRRTGGKKP
jgi:hypothetical protein